VSALLDFLIRKADGKTLTVADMLIAILNCCSKEELEEEERGEVPTSPVSPTTEKEILERRKVIKNKILAVGRISRVFSLLRCVPRQFSVTIVVLNGNPHL
jgi:hypothetical protein